MAAYAPSPKPKPDPHLTVTLTLSLTLTLTQALTRALTPALTPTLSPTPTLTQTQPVQVTMRLLAQQTLAGCPNFRGKHVSKSNVDLLSGEFGDLLKLPGDVSRALTLALTLALTPSPTS